MSALTDETLDAIAACGFDVFQNADPKWRSYVFFTDGKRIGYLQRSRFGGMEIATVHIPNPRSGTGFSMGPVEPITRDNLVLAFAHAPQWADRPSRESVRKWPSIEAMDKKLVKVREATGQHAIEEKPDRAGGGFDGSYGLQGGNE